MSPLDSAFEPFVESLNFPNEPKEIHRRDLKPGDCLKIELADKQGELWLRVENLPWDDPSLENPENPQPVCQIMERFGLMDKMIPKDIPGLVLVEDLKTGNRFNFGFYSKQKSSGEERLVEVPLSVDVTKIDYYDHDIFPNGPWASSMSPPKDDSKGNDGDLGDQDSLGGERIPVLR